MCARELCLGSNWRSRVGRCHKAEAEAKSEGTRKFAAQKLQPHFAQL